MNPNEGAPNIKTRYDYIVSQGPEYLALLIAMSKISAIEKACKKFGLSYEVPDNLRDDIVLEHLEELCKPIDD